MSLYPKSDQHALLLSSQRMESETICVRKFDMGEAISNPRNLFRRGKDVNLFEIDDGETRELNKDDEKFLKNYIEKKMWVFKNKGKSHEDEKEMKKQEKREAEFNSPYDMHEYDLKLEDMEPCYNVSTADRIQLEEMKSMKKPVKSDKIWQRLVQKFDRGEAISFDDIQPYESRFLFLPISRWGKDANLAEPNGGTGKSSKKSRRKGGLEEGKPSKERRKAYGLGDIETNNKKKKNQY